VTLACLSNANQNPEVAGEEEKPRLPGLKLLIGERNDPDDRIIIEVEAGFQECVMRECGELDEVNDVASFCGVGDCFSHS